MLAQVLFNRPLLILDLLGRTELWLISAVYSPAAASQGDHCYGGSKPHRSREHEVRIMNGT